MSLVGYKSSNHTQQVRKRGALDTVDDRGTRWDLIREAEAEFGALFTLDVAASPANAKAPRFFTVEDNGLAQSWATYTDIHGKWCRCLCHQTTREANGASKGSGGAASADLSCPSSPSGPTKTSPRASDTSASTADANALASTRRSAEPTPADVNRSAKQPSVTARETRTAPRSDDRARSTTTAGSSAPETSLGSGHLNSGRHASSGGEFALTAPGQVHSSRTTSSRSGPTIVPGRSPGTSSRRAPSATDPRAPGDRSDSWLMPSRGSTSTCERCVRCTPDRPLIWLNPPYSDIEPWVAKAWAEYERTRGIAMLLPGNRAEQPWWQTHIELRRDRPGSPLRTRFLAGRTRFDRPGAVIDPRGDRPPFGCCLLTWKPEGVSP